MDTPLSLPCFVATRLEDVPVGLVRYLSVDGSVPGAAVTWDHHVTGERINLDAMPETFDASGFDGVGTTLADLDAAASVVAIAFGGKGALPHAARAILECGSHWCDHLSPHPGHDAATNRLGRGLLDAVITRLAGPSDGSSTRFAEVCADLIAHVLRGDTLPYADTYEKSQVVARALEAAGRLVDARNVAWVDRRGCNTIDPTAIYERLQAPVALFVDEHPRGGVKYTVGVNPWRPDRPTDLRAALHALAALEFAAGPPCMGAAPVAGNENWGGRSTVFGSPFNYGSRLAPEDVMHTLAERIPANGRQP